MAKSFTKLTRPAARALKPGGKIMEHGITFERSANGDGVYSINVMVDGQRIHRVVGRESEGTTRTHAEQYIEKVRIEARDNRLNLPKGRKMTLGFRTAATQYIERLKAEGGKDIEMKEQRLRLHLVPFFGDKPLSQIASFDIERYKKQRVAEPIMPKGGRAAKADAKPAPLTKPGTVNREIAALSHLINKAVEWHWLDRRPARLKRLKEGEGRIVYLTAEQAESLLAAAAADENTQLHAFIMIGLHTAMRRWEILSIRLEHVDLDKRTIFIPEAKAGARVQPITDELAEYLQPIIAAMPKGSEWLFPSNAEVGHTVDVSKAFRRVVEAAGLEPKHVTPHTLRHTAISHLVQAGVDLPTVKRISGHKTLVMVERYAHQDGPHIAAAMAKLGKRIKRSATAA